jgi:hypothetical protein
LTAPRSFLSLFVKTPLAAGLLAASAGLSAGAASPFPSAQPAPQGRWRNASLEEYRTHLSQLVPLVEACRKARDLKNCDPLLVGPDDRVPLGNGPDEGRRIVRYGWLRVLFFKAEEPDEAPAQPASRGERGQSGTAQPPSLTTSQLLDAAETRIAGDLVQASGPPPQVPSYTEERTTMNAVLAGRDFRGIEQPSVRDTVMEKVSGWLNHLLQSATRLRAHSAWVGRLVVWGFVLGVCVALALFLVQLERRWRLRLTPERRDPAPSAASARDWQLWLGDARRAADAGLWREAVHFVYWAAIARLESRHLWPADRARTPREYLALVAVEDPRRPGLAALTGAFERIWYGGRPAGENDYRQAEDLARGLMEGGAA